MPRTRLPRTAWPSWPLVVACLVAGGNVLAVGLLPKSVASRYGAILLGAGLGALVVVACYACVLYRRRPQLRAAVLVGGPCDGRLMLSPGSEIPAEVWVLGPDSALCTYRPDGGVQAGSPVLRYQQPDIPRPLSTS